MPITDYDSLVDHLKTAIAIEHATIAPYLCALYSIPEGTNHEAQAIVRSVVMEEMLHMTLAANVLVAVGGKPVIASAAAVPRYPAYLPHSNKRFQVQLLPLGREALQTFLLIESPAPASAPPEGDHYNTLGQFYAAVEDGLRFCAKKYGERKLFSGKRAMQVPPERWYYGGGGDCIEVHNLETALRALDEITEQGEGYDGGITDGDGAFNDVDELAHFHRFNELLQGRRYVATDSDASGPTGDELPVDWSVIAPMAPNPRTSQYRRHRTIHQAMVTFNRTYTRLLQQLQLAFTGRPAALQEAVPIMYEMRYQAQALMRIPSPIVEGKTVGPAFEYDAS
ncbi:MAG: ferritin-like protein [Gemmatimonadaceae bacterium]|nr:ferritin-like protein [Gemmatimonadaceae bacterium]